MEVKFTPAPWAFQKFGKDFYLTAQHGMREIILAGSKGGQLRMNQDGILLPVNPNHPNAKLICAAPKMAIGIIKTLENKGLHLPMELRKFLEDIIKEI
jgi:hypothetical protein